MLETACSSEETRRYPVSSVHSFLDWIVEERAREAYFLNMISLMEYIGFRKILRNVPFERVTVNQLRHMYEEAGHSYLLKKTLIEWVGEEVPWSHSKMSEMAWQYFKTLEARIQLEHPDSYDCYERVSQTVEARVLGIYPLWLEKTKQPQIKKVLSFILKQEERHAEQFTGDKTYFAECEQEAFEVLLRATKAQMLGLGSQWPK